MKRDEKILLTKKKIIDTAMVEFSNKSYSEASINTICASANISKGIIYHYFKDKDELYLTCLQKCYSALTEYTLDNYQVNKNSVDKNFEEYFNIMYQFYHENPVYLKIFAHTVMHPPVHLEHNIKEIEKKLDDITIKFLSEVLESVPLQKNVTMEEIIEVFQDFQDFIYARYQMKNYDESFLLEHQKRCLRTLHILLYGVIERK